MNKKADWKESLQNALKDKRLLGAGIAGLVGGAAGAFGLPDLIYKKPTAGSRVGLGLSTGALAALATAAAMRSGEKDSDVMKQLSDLAHNTPNLLSRKTVPELKEMSPLTRFVTGYTGGGKLTQYLNPFRAIKGGLPDWSGLTGSKSAREKRLQETGDLPKADEPNRLLSWSKALVNLPLATGAGAMHAHRINQRFQQRELAKALANVAPELKDALRGTREGLQLKALAKKFDPNRGSIKNFLGNVADTYAAKANVFGADKLLPKLRNYNKSINPNTAASNLLSRITELNRAAIKSGRAPILTGDQLNLLKNIGTTGVKKSLGRNIWTGVRGVGRGLGTLALLGAVEELASGGASNRTMRNDLARNLNLE